MISLRFSAPSLMSEKEIRANPRHSAFTEAMFQDVLRSKSRFDTLVAQDWNQTDFVISERKNGKCTYASVGSDFGSAILTLFSSSGVDYIKQEVIVAENLRERRSERFSIQAAMESYSTKAITLALELAKLYTTIEHGCYERICMSDALIGNGKISLVVSNN